MTENSGYTLIEVMVVVVLMGLTSLAVVAVMNVMSNALTDSHNRMTASTFGMELRNHLDKINPSNGVSYCMQHPSSGGGYSKSLGGMVSDLGTVKQIIDGAQFKDNPGNQNLRIPIDAKVLFTGESVYGGSGAAKSGDYLTLMNSELHSFIIRKRIMAYQISSPKLVLRSAHTPQPYIFLVSAVLENRFYKGAVPTSVADRQQNRIVTSKINVNFVVRHVVANSKPYEVIDCGIGTLARTTAFAESCRSLGADFEYVVDYPNGNPVGTRPTGQCYAPQYRLLTGATPDGTKPGVVMAYAPIRAFLCESLFDGKSLNMPFCTGSY